MAYIPLAYSLSCAIRANCNADEKCLFSLYNTENSHVGNCNYFDYKLCCDEIINAEIKDSCISNEAAILSLYQENDSHVEFGSENYQKKLCIQTDSQSLMNCSLKSSCSENESQLISLFNQTNSHVGLSYDNKLCCKILRPDMVINSSSLSISQNPNYGDAFQLNITVFNIGDFKATNVNISCYANGTYFDSDIINISAHNSSIAKCLWIADCNSNITIKADPLNEIKEYDENNNEASFIIEINEQVSISIISPIEQENWYRNQTIPLKASVSLFCHNISSSEYNVTWYNSSMHEIATGNETSWQIPITYKIGTETITAKAVTQQYGNASSFVLINILNNLPNISQLMFEPSGVLVDDMITISCNITDVENSASNLSVNISIRNPYGEWNISQALRLGNTFYRDWVAKDPEGIYLARCEACDLDNGCSQRNGTFGVYRWINVTISLNSTEVWWNESVLISGTAIRSDLSKVDTSEDPDSDVRVYINNILSAITETNAEGFYNVTIYAPLSIGTYIINVSVKDPIMMRYFSNTTILEVKPTYGGTKREKESARNVGCYEQPMIIQNPDGSIQTVVARICTWK